MIPDGPCGFAIPDEASLLLLSTGEVVARVQTRRVDPEYCNMATLNRVCARGTRYTSRA